MTTSLVTTAIPFVNARPHVGFAYELVLADILARHRRRRGRDVRFVTGTDDNSLKNVVAAAREGLAPAQLVARNTDAFRDLAPLYGATPDDFVQTSTDPRHRTAVDRLWRTCAARGDFYRNRWQGRYCAGCEAFVDDDIILCDEHGTAPEPVSEDNWFFRLSRYRDPIRDAIRTGRLAIISDAARAETLAFLDGDVRDLSVSREATRSAGWGIPVPDDPGQVIYVWFDALANYLSSLGYGSPDHSLVDRFWHGGDRSHVIGKGITRFHTVYWPAFLLSAGLPLPDRILVHGYLTVDGRKISKSKRDVDVDVTIDVDAASIVNRTGSDAARWYFARACRTRNDADLSVADIRATHDRDLADRLGNLVQRCSALAAKLSAARIPDPGPETPDAARLRALATALPDRVDAALDAFLPDDAAAVIIDLVDQANRCLEATAPWRLARTDPARAASAVYAPLEAARFATGELAPFVPGIAQTIAARLGDASLAPVWGELRAGSELRIGAPPVPRIV